MQYKHQYYPSYIPSSMYHMDIVYTHIQNNQAYTCIPHTHTIVYQSICTKDNLTYPFLYDI